jgi:hypothetical protein
MRNAIPPTCDADRIVGMCSYCGWLGVCVEEFTPLRRLRLRCSNCQPSIERKPVLREMTAARRVERVR